MLIKERNIWVLEITAEGEEPDIISVTAATRKSRTVAAITKVFSKPTWRGLGCAEMLVRHVCEECVIPVQLPIFNS
jgi:predicted GNAT family acetyltransferase